MLSNMFIKGLSQPRTASAVVDQAMNSNSLDRRGEAMKIELKRMAAQASNNMAARRMVSVVMA